MEEKQDQTHTDSPIRKKRKRLYELPAEEPHETAAEIPRETAAASRPAAPPLFQDDVVSKQVPKTPVAPNVEPEDAQAPPKTHTRTDTVAPDPAAVAVESAHVPRDTDGPDTNGDIIRANPVSAAKLDDVLTQHVYAAVAIGLVPLPLVDFVLITGIQINLLRVLTKLYGLPFTNGPVKKFIGSLVASVAPVAAAPALASSISQTIPLVGHGVGLVTMPILGGAATYALGKVFIQHFATGGTLLSFNPENMRTYYQRMFREGQQVAIDMRNEKKS